MINVEYDVIGMCATNTYCVFDSDTGKMIIIDPAGSADRIFARIARKQATPEAILLTHGHVDHILAVDEIRDRYHIPVYACEAERELLNSPYMNLSLDFTGKECTVEADKYLNGGNVIRLLDRDITCIATPGHTVGGMCFYFKEDGILFSGDTLFRESVGRSDLPTGDGALLIRSIKDKLMILPDDTVVYPGHMDATTIGYERRNNYFLD